MANTTSFITARVLADAGLALDETTDHAVVPGEDHSAGGHHGKGEAQIIFFLFGSLFLGGVFREINKKTGIPYTPMLFIVGIALGYYNAVLGVFGESIYTISNVDPHGLLLIFLPTLIFESGFNADWHIFKRQFVQIFILAVPCVIVSAIFIAFSMKVVLGYTDAYYTWLTAFVFGAILSCTDTVAVLALLKEAGASKKFNSLIEGESLINDGTCMVLLTIAAQFIAAGQAEEYNRTAAVLIDVPSMTPWTVLVSFCELTLGGAVLGVIFGVISTVWIRKIFNDEILVVNITLIACYLLYYVAENVNIGIQVSGIIALVALGLFMAAFGKTRINAESEHAVHTFWKYAVYVAETIIFLMAGIIIGIKVLLGEKEADALPITEDDLFKLFGLYLCMTVCRFLAIGVFMPILRRQGYGLTWKEVSVLTYGGLRGAIGISFALIVAGDRVHYNPTLRHFILFDMAGCAFLTLIINGTTTGWLVRRMGLAGGSPIKQRVFIGYLEQFIQQIRDYEEELKVQPYLSAVDWSRVNDFVGLPKLEYLLEEEMSRLVIKDPTYVKPAAGASRKKKSQDDEEVVPRDNNLDQQLLNKDEGGKFSVYSQDDDFDDDTTYEKLTIEARNRFLMALKGEYYHLFALSQCGAGAFLLLKESADWDLDKDSSTMTSWDHVSSHFMNPTYIRFLFFCKGLPIVGQWAKNSLFNHLAYVYDVVLNYVNAHESCETIAESFPFQEDVLSVILKESEENKTLAEGYLNNYLNISFPEINKSIQMKKASYSILNRQREFLEETYNQGQLEDKEFKLLKKVIDQLSYSLGEITDPWDLPPLNEFIKRLIFFSYFSDEEIQEIMLDSTEKPFNKDEFIVKEGQKADYLYVITRGVATESRKDTSSHFKEKKTTGSVISYHQIISNIQRYQTSVVADSVVYALRLNIQTIKKIIRKHKAVEEYLWRESFYFLVKIYTTELAMFEQVDRPSLAQILSLFTFKKYKPDQIIDFSKGGIFLKGNAVSINDRKANQYLRPTSEEEQPAKKYHSLTYFAPGINKNTLKTEKHSWVFHFNNFEKIADLIQSGAVEREKSRSKSFASFRKGSTKQTIKVHKNEPVISERDEDNRDLENGDYLSPNYKISKLDTIKETDTN